MKLGILLSIVLAWVCYWLINWVIEKNRGFTYDELIETQRRTRDTVQAEINQRISQIQREAQESRVDQPIYGPDGLRTQFRNNLRRRALNDVRAMNEIHESRTPKEDFITEEDMKL